MPQKSNRREFLRQGAVVSSVIGSGYFVNPTPAVESKSPNERLNIAAVGATGRAGNDIKELASQNIVAIADVDQNLLEKGSASYKGVRKYEDFRVMLEKEAPHIDAVMVGTPDHTHAPAAAMAMKMGKHCYCEKPLAHTVVECRTLAELAAEKKLVTQVGSQIHAGDNYRRVVELVQTGAIGPIKDVHVWVQTAHTYHGGKFTTDKPTPAGLNWDLWLGPAVERPYTEGAHPFFWRRFWDYGTGQLGDFGCHYMDLVHWALKLRAPTKVVATGSPVDPVSASEWSIVNYDYPARDNMPPVRMTWYDGGKRPELFPSIMAMLPPDKDGKPAEWKSGQLFVGEKGMILSNYGTNILLPAEKFADFKRPEPFIPKSLGHHNEWVNAIKNGGPTTCNFDYSGALSEAIVLGVIAYRTGKEIQWDAKNLKITNAPEAQQLLHKEYRKGWTM